MSLCANRFSVPSLPDTQFRRGRRAHPTLSGTMTSMRSLLLFALPVFAFAQTGRVTAEIGKTTVYEGLALSPDGKNLAWTQTVASQEQPKLWIGAVGGTFAPLPFASAVHNGSTAAASARRGRDADIARALPRPARSSAAAPAATPSALASANDKCPLTAPAATIGNGD